MQTRPLSELLVPAADDALTLLQQWVQEGNSKLVSQSRGSGAHPTSSQLHHRLLLLRRGETSDRNVALNSSSSSISLIHPRGDEELTKLQVTTRSPMGAMAYHTVGLLAYNGLVRVFGAGSSSAPSGSSKEPGPVVKSDDLNLDDLPLIFNSITSATTLALNCGALPNAGAVTIADDVFGGIFVLNGGAFQATKPGNVCYIPPDVAPISTIGDGAVEVEDMGFGYSDFINAWLLDPERALLWYKSWLFDGWEQKLVKEIYTPTPRLEDLTYSFYPPLWSAEARDINKVSRKAVPVREIWSLWRVQK